MNVDIMSRRVKRSLLQLVKRYKRPLSCILCEKSITSHGIFLYSFELLSNVVVCKRIKLKRTGVTPVTTVLVRLQNIRGAPFGYFSTSSVIYKIVIWCPGSKNQNEKEKLGDLKLRIITLPKLDHKRGADTSNARSCA